MDTVAKDIGRYTSPWFEDGELINIKQTFLPYPYTLLLEEGNNLLNICAVSSSFKREATALTLAVFIAFCLFFWKKKIKFITSSCPFLPLCWILKSLISLKCLLASPYFLYPIFYDKNSLVHWKHMWANEIVLQLFVSKTYPMSCLQWF